MSKIFVIYDPPSYDEDMEIVGVLDLADDQVDDLKKIIRDLYGRNLSSVEIDKITKVKIEQVPRYFDSEEGENK
jgi:hypothetical protein